MEERKAEKRKGVGSALQLLQYVIVIIVAIYRNNVVTMQYLVRGLKIPSAARPSIHLAKRQAKRVQ